MQSPTKGAYGGSGSKAPQGTVDRSKIVGTPIEIIQGKYKPFIYFDRDQTDKTG